MKMHMTGLQLAEWREGHGLSQSGFAEILGVSRQTIIAWEKADSVARLVQIAVMAVDAGIIDLQSYRRGTPGRPSRKARSHNFLYSNLS